MAKVPVWEEQETKNQFIVPNEEYVFDSDEDEAILAISLIPESVYLNAEIVQWIEFNENGKIMLPNVMVKLIINNKSYPVVLIEGPFFDKLKGSVSA